jgi:glycosyltransferase involved in cell wall biosynthesis
MVANSAFLYIPDNYSTREQALTGRRSASESFLLAFGRHAEVDRYYCFSHHRAAAVDFHQRMRAEAVERTTHFISTTRPDKLAEPGCLFRPGPDIGWFAWQRRSVGERAYSLCGITHTTAETTVMDSIAQLITAPVHPWDALVCTSKAVKRMVTNQLEQWQDYLVKRLAATLPPQPELPIIPLGIDCQRFRHDPAQRQHWRERLGIGPDDVVLLFLGRLSIFEKANPLPLLLGAEAAARRTGRRLHLVFAGWFPGSRSENALREGMAELAPSVTHHILDGREPAVRTGIWSAADIFASLPDNIQETFGLTPLEAMAAGLPVIASDWDGYRETVRDGLDGILVPTAMPGPGHGRDIAEGYAIMNLSYTQYCGAAAAATSVDPHACGEALVRLVEDPALRRRMGEAGRARADEFDWRHIIPAYQALWAELEARRRAEAPAAAVDNPKAPDPFFLFEAYPSVTLGPATGFRVVTGADAAAVARFQRLGLTRDAADGRLALPPVEALLAHFAAAPASTGEAAIAACAPAGADLVLRGLGWLVKIGYLAVD